MRGVCGVGILVFVIGSAVPAQAQDNLQNLWRQVTTGDLVKVKEANGRQTIGVFDKVSKSALSVRMDGEVAEIAANDVREVLRRGDSIRNGLFIGGGIGAGLGYGYSVACKNAHPSTAAATTTTPSTSTTTTTTTTTTAAATSTTAVTSNSPCIGAVPLGIAAGLVGVGIGALIDRIVPGWSVAYRSRGMNYAIIPAIGPSARGINASVTIVVPKLF